MTLLHLFTIIFCIIIYLNKKHLITELSLRFQQLTVIPPEIGSLVNLKQLSLDYNQISVIPPEIGGLVNLEGLHLVNSQISPTSDTITDLRGRGVYVYF